MEERPARKVEDLTPEQIREAGDQMLALVDERLPERFYGREPTWRLCLTALIARMAGIVESMQELTHLNRQRDALVLLRALYEHLVTFLWLAIDPAPRVHDWYSHAMRQRGTLHHEVRAYGVENLLTEDELRVAMEAERLEPLEQRANQADEHWGPRIRGFYTNPASGPKHLLTLGGLYVVLYRIASRDAHATIESIDPWLTEEGGGRTIVTRQPRDTGGLLWSALAVPLFAMALVVAHERLGWPDEASVREINDALVREDK